MVLYEISDIGYSNVRFVTRNDRYTWSEDEILKYWIRDGKKLVNDPNGLIDKLKNRFFVPSPPPSAQKS